MTALCSCCLPPPLFGLFMQQMRLRAVRRLPIAFGWLTKRGDAATARWMKPVLTRPEIRRDAVRMLRAAAADTRFPLDQPARLAQIIREFTRASQPVREGRQLPEPGD